MATERLAGLSPKTGCKACLHVQAAKTSCGESTQVSTAACSGRTSVVCCLRTSSTHAFAYVLPQGFRDARIPSEVLVTRQAGSTTVATSHSASHSGMADRPGTHWLHLLVDDCASTAATSDDHSNNSDQHHATCRICQEWGRS